MSFVTQAEVIEIIKHNEYIREYILLLDKNYKYNPGSFAQLTLEVVTASDIWPDSRTFSIASYEGRLVKFIIKKTGQYTTRIFTELQVGSKCTIKYPFGDLFDVDNINDKQLFIASGIGITPYFSLIKYFEIVGKLNNITLFYSAQKSYDLLHLSELKGTLGKNVEFYITREKIDIYHNRRISLDDINRVADSNTSIYICGSKEFNRYFKELLESNGFMKLHLDEWE